MVPSKWCRNGVLADTFSDFHELASLPAVIPRDIYFFESAVHFLKSGLDGIFTLIVAPDLACDFSDWRTFFAPQCAQESPGYVFHFFSLISFIPEPIWPVRPILVAVFPNFFTPAF